MATDLHVRLHPGFSDGEYHIIHNPRGATVLFPAQNRMFAVDEQTGLLLSGYKNKTLGVDSIESARSVLDDLRNRMQAGGPNVKPFTFSPADKSQLLLLMSEGCNLSCQYCFVTEMNQHYSYMTEEIATTALKSYPAQTIKFFGGEPLLKFDTIRKVVHFANSYYPEILHKSRPRYSIITNGTLITEEVARFFAENNFYVMVSLDGPKDVTDIQRPHVSGKSTYELTTGGIDKLRKAGKTFSIQGTYTSNHIRFGYTVRDVVNHLIGLGAFRAHVEPVFGQSVDGFSGLYLLSREQIDSVASEFRELAAESVESMLTDKPLRVYYVHAVLRTILEGRPSTHSCNAGISNVTIDTKGQAYPCYFLMQSDLLMGKVNDQDLSGGSAFLKVQDRMLSNKRDAIIPCLDCWARGLCTPCYGYEQSDAKSLFTDNPIPYEYCAIMRAVLEGTISKLTELRSDSTRLAALFKSLETDSQWVES